VLIIQLIVHWVLHCWILKWVFQSGIIKHRYEYFECSNELQLVISEILHSVQPFSESVCRVRVVSEWHIVFVPSWIFKRNFHSKQPGDIFLKFFKVCVYQQQSYCTCGLKVLWVLVRCRWSDSRHPVAVVRVDLWTGKTAVCVLKIITHVSHCTKWTGLQGESCPSGYHEGIGGGGC